MRIVKNEVIIDGNIEKSKFKVGDKVIYTNDNGVCWGEKKIVKIVSWYGTDRRYYITPTDTPWTSVGEECLKQCEEKESDINPF